MQTIQPDPGRDAFVQFFHYLLHHNRFVAACTTIVALYKLSVLFWGLSLESVIQPDSAFVWLILSCAFPLVMIVIMFLLWLCVLCVPEERPHYHQEIRRNFVALAGIIGVVDCLGGGIVNGLQIAGKVAYPWELWGVMMVIPFLLVGLVTLWMLFWIFIQCKAMFCPRRWEIQAV